MIHKHDADEFRRRVGYILLQQWDPIGVRDEPAAQNEYDAYVYGVCRLLVDRASEQAISMHLLIAERDAMGLGGTPEMHRCAVARALRALEVPWDGSRPSA